ncbi:hypothetical protein PFISCL1PPCAC_5652 [Pristionchus fissidentatus]|uniref:Uncharacterized protein n=1 Tax=Pristionchus fissidentatus TaxID=1538716 RepID=A0AAV5V8X3_9BILA|nr:hypothetical protein PFISCL1PPCAC_5652 [Pristionchus fissidentatus]
MTMPSSPAPSSSDSSLYPSSTDSDGSPERGVARRHPAPAQLAPRDAEPARGGHFGGAHLFTLTVSLPEGTIVSSKMMRENDFDSEDLTVGSSLLKALHGNCQQFFLSAAINTPRQRLYSRIRTSGRMSHACELQCEFDRVAGVARVAGFALQSAYAPQAGPSYQQLTFITKHASSGALTHIDLSCIPYLGHLPTDMIGRSLLCFVYAPDVNIVRQAHLDLHASKGRIVRSSSSIRFVAFNGALIRADTEWSAYVNPWTRKMELVVARHKLVDAPVGDANVMGVPVEGFESPVLPQPMIRLLEDDLRQIMARLYHTPTGHHLLSPPSLLHIPHSLQVAIITLLELPVRFPLGLLNVPINLTFTIPVGSSQAAAAAAAAATGLPTATTQFALQAKDLSAYIEKLVETLVVNGTQALEQAKALRINCLENVHRLLKSQARYEENGDEAEVQNDTSNLGPSIPLTRESLMEHTRRYEAEYRATWSKRLSGALKRPLTIDMMPTTSGACEVAPAPKLARPSSSGPAPIEWTPAQREEYYRSQQNPAVPAGMNYQITTVPLPSPKTVQQAAARRSAFSTVTRAHLDIAQQAKNFGPLTVATFDPPVSVIKSTEPQGLLLEATKLA